MSYIGPNFVKERTKITAAFLRDVVQHMRRWSRFKVGPGLELRMLPTPFLALVGQAGGGSAATGYTGPFQCSKTGSLEITVGASRGTDTYNFFDHVQLSNIRKSFTASEAIDLTGKYSASGFSYVYYEITLSGSTITATLTAASSYPAETDGMILVQLCNPFIVDDMISSVNQIQRGQIQFPMKFTG